MTPPPLPTLLMTSTCSNRRGLNLAPRQNPTYDERHLLFAAAASKSAWPPEVSMPLSLSLPELLELASSDIPEELLEELQFGNNGDISLNC